MVRVGEVSEIEAQQRAIHYEFDEFETEQLQKYGIVNVTIKPKITGAVVARVSQLSNNNIYFDHKYHKFMESISRYEYESLRRDINAAIRQRAVELADKKIAETGKLNSAYSVVVDLDDRLDKMLTDTINSHMIEIKRSRLKDFYRSALAGMLYTDEYKDAVEKRIANMSDEQLLSTDIETLKKDLLTFVESIKDDDRAKYIQQLKNEIEQLKNEIKQLRDKCK